MEANIETESLQQNITRTIVLQKEIEHLSSDVNNLSGELADFSLKINRLDKLLDKIAIRAEDDLVRREASEKIVKYLSDKMRDVFAITQRHDEKIEDHSIRHLEIEPRLRKVESVLQKTSNIGVFLKWLASGLITAVLFIYATDSFIDRNAKIEEKRLENEHRRQMEMLQEEQKKKTIENNMKKYELRTNKQLKLNGVMNG